MQRDRQVARRWQAKEHGIQALRCFRLHLLCASGARCASKAGHRQGRAVMCQGDRRQRRSRGRKRKGTEWVCKHVGGGGREAGLLPGLRNIFIPPSAVVSQKAVTFKYVCVVCVVYIVCLLYIVCVVYIVFLLCVE